MEISIIKLVYFPIFGINMFQNKFLLFIFSKIQLMREHSINENAVKVSGKITFDLENSGLIEIN